MRNLLLSISALALMPSLAFAIGVPTSGIDWESSTISIEVFEAAHPLHEANFQCFGGRFENLPIEVQLNQIAFSSPTSGPDIDAGMITGSTCFQQAGDYQLRIRLVDQAGNVGTAESYVLTVRSAEARELLTTLRPVSYVKETDNPNLAEPVLTGSTDNCTEEQLLANAKDDCQLRLSLRDNFGNVVVIPNPIGSMDVTGRTPPIKTTLDTYDDAASAFVHGLRVEDGIAAIPFSTDANGDFDFSVSALAPSIELITSVENPAFQLSRIIPRLTNFSFPAPNIAEDGSVGVGSFPVVKSVDLQFEPWVKLFLSDVSPDGNTFRSPNEPVYFLLGEQKNLYAFAGTLLDHFLPNGFEAFVQGFTRSASGLAFREENLTEGLTINFAGNQQSQDSNFLTTMRSSNGLGSDENVAFGSRISHSFGGAESDKTVLYPGGNLGSAIGPDPAFDEDDITLPDNSIPGGQEGTATALLVGADIEGKILTETDITLVNGDATEIVNLGGISVADIREDITRNAEILTRGLSPIDLRGAAFDFNDETLYTADVAYFENETVTLSGSSFSAGSKTIVIRDGNLFIPNDIAYGTVYSSLGVILINSNVNDPENGHIFVGNGVQRFVGTYYAEGGMLSTTATAGTEPSYTDIIASRSQTNVDNPSAPLGKQLLLEGTILTNNTLGGALLDPPRGPDGSLASRDDAMRYDLHFVRRYVPPLDDELNPLDDASNADCVKGSVVGNPNQCDENKHSFIVRTDGRVQNLTPPGFNEISGFSAR